MADVGDGLAAGTDLVAAAESAVGQALERLGGRRPDLLCVFVCGGNPETIAAAGTALCMAGLATIQLATPPGLVDADVVLRLVTAALAGVLAALATVLSQVVILWLLAAVVVAQVVFELATHERHAGQLAGPI